jgi:hypothetical protein
LLLLLLLLMLMLLLALSYPSIPVTSTAAKELF